MFNCLVPTCLLAPPKDSHSVLDSGTSKLPDRHPEKNPRPGSEIVYATAGHSVTQANPDNPGSISRVMQVSHFLLSCLKSPFFQTSQPDGYQPLCLHTIKKWLPPQSWPARSFFMCLLNIQSRVGAQESKQSHGQNLPFSTYVSNFPDG